MPSTETIHIPAGGAGIGIRAGDRVRVIDGGRQVADVFAFCTDDPPSITALSIRGCTSTGCSGGG